MVVDDEYAVRVEVTCKLITRPKLAERLVTFVIDVCMQDGCQ